MQRELVVRVLEDIIELQGMCSDSRRCSICPFMQECYKVNLYGSLTWDIYKDITSQRLKSAKESIVNMEVLGDEPRWIP